MQSRHARSIARPTRSPVAVEVGPAADLVLEGHEGRVREAAPDQPAPNLIATAADVVVPASADLPVVGRPGAYAERLLLQIGIGAMALAHDVSAVAVVAWPERHGVADARPERRVLRRKAQEAVEVPEVRVLEVVRLGRSPAPASEAVATTENVRRRRDKCVLRVRIREAWPLHQSPAIPGIGSCARRLRGHRLRFRPVGGAHERRADGRGEAADDRRRDPRRHVPDVAQQHLAPTNARMAARP